MEYGIHKYKTPPSTIRTSLEANNTQISVTNLYWNTYLWAFINVILLVCILGGNALTIIAVRTCRRLRCLISNMFICSLAVSDFIVGLSLPYHLAFYLGSNWGHEHALCLIRFYLIIFACCVSILTLIAISIDRYIAIIYPLHYRRYMTRQVGIFIITIAWFFGATVAAVPMFWNNWNIAYECEFDEVLPPWYMAGIITPGFAIIWMLMFFMYWRITKEASKQAIRWNSPRKRKHSNYILSDCRSIHMVIFIMGCFSICWLPYFIVACTQIFKICNIEPLVYKATFSLAMTNSALNPVIYAWKNSSFSKTFICLLHCKSPNCYQTFQAFSKESPKSQKGKNGCTTSSAQCRISRADAEIYATKVSTQSIQSDGLPKIYTVSK